VLDAGPPLPGGQILARFREKGLRHVQSV
jgi:hypothetical protein